MRKDLSENTVGLFLLIALLLFLVVPIPITFFPEHQRLIFAGVYSLLIFIGIRSVTDNRLHFITGLLLGLTSLVLVWVCTFKEELQTPNVLRTISLFLFFTYLAYHLFRSIAFNKAISINMIFASISGYLLIGIIGGTLFQFLELAMPGSFTLLSENNDLFDLHYLSFVTLTTLGYGDITPNSEAAKSLTMLIGLAGQLYLTILIAILVGKYLKDPS